ncbi:hypothetical protein MYA_1804 [Burkholderia sp. KJ006]|nr:hypothetical protein MYA_1804 [Burkholderia sp. KJ006]
MGLKPAAVPPRERPEGPPFRAAGTLVAPACDSARANARAASPSSRCHPKKRATFGIWMST